jgi:hypothetical protein
MGLDIAREKDGTLESNGDLEEAGIVLCAWQSVGVKTALCE